MTSQLNTVDILFITVNPRETEALAFALSEASQAPVRAQGYRHGDPYDDYGYINGQRVAHTVAMMGSSQSGGSRETVQKALEDLQPKLLIAVGIAWGANEDDGQHIGDLLLSQQVQLGSPSKIMEGSVVLRGAKPEIAARPVKLIEATQRHQFPQIPLHRGVLLSRDDLFDNKELRDQFRVSVPELVGGEMEGQGIYEALRDAGSTTPWLIVKAICDWGYKKNADKVVKDQNQRLAAANAANLCVAAVQSYKLVSLSNERETEGESESVELPETLSPEIVNAVAVLDASMRLQVALAIESLVQTSYERHTYFSTLVFPNQQKRLKDFYLPLTLVVGTVPNKQELLVIDTYPATLLDQKKAVLVVDTAGMGKSTVLKFMFIQAVEQRACIPIFLELRKLSRSVGVFEYLRQKIKMQDGPIEEGMLHQLLASGEFVFFLDGFDEIADEYRATVVSELIQFKQQAARNLFVVSSRDQVGLNVLSDFFKVTIKPLAYEEAEALILKYSQGNEMGQSLIDKIKRPENKPTHEFLTNPLLVSLLFKAYEFKQAIPLKKHVFYRQVFEALFENHDLSKDGGELSRAKLTGLDIHSFELVMRALGFVSLQTGKIEYPKDELLLIVEKLRSLVPTISFNPQALLQDLVARVPLFVLDGNTYRWNHKSLQEYFAALYVSAEGREVQEKILKVMYYSPKASSYLNFLTLFRDIDPKGFRHVLIPMLVAEVSEEFVKPEFPGVSPEDQAIRRGFTAFRDGVLVNLSDSEFMQTAPDQGRVIFEKAVEALSQFRAYERRAGEHGLTPQTVVWLYDERYTFMVALIRALRLSFMRMVRPGETAQTRLLRGSLPENIAAYHPLVELPDDVANLPGNFRAVNEFLLGTSELISFDAEKAKQEELDIAREIQQEAAQQMSF